MAERRPRVVVGVDERTQSERALDFAAWEARSLSARLDLVRGLEMPFPSSHAAYIPYREAAHLWMSRLVEETRQRFPDLEVVGSAVAGSGKGALLDRAKDADLLVVGSRSRSTARSILLGSVSTAVAAHATCPVVVVRGTGDEGRRVVVGVDGSETGHAAAGFAFDEAARRGLPLEVVYVWSLEPYSAPGLWAAQMPVDEYLRDSEQLVKDELVEFRRRYPQVEVQVRVLYGHPAPVLADRSAGTALLVVGSRGRGGIAGLLLGSVSQGVLHHADCPVAVVHPVSKS